MGLGWPPVNEDSNGNPPFPIGNTSRNGGISSQLCTGVFRFLLGGAKKGGRWSVDFVGNSVAKSGL